MQLSTDTPAPSVQPRRGFLAKTAALGAWAAAWLAPLGAGLAALVHPMRLKGRSGEDFYRLTSLDALPEDGAPRRFPVLAERRDAWNVFPSEPVGAVFLRRTGKEEVVAFQVKCPHLGCAIGYVEEGKGPEAVKKFFCPCHRASFDLDGVRTDAVSESPRDMDALEVKIERGEVLVRYQNFRTGTTVKEEEV